MSKISSAIFLKLNLLLVPLVLVGFRCGIQGGVAPSQTESTTSSCVPSSTATSSYFPTDYSGLVLWLKADAISGLSEGEEVTTWSDSSTSGSHFTQITASYKPVFKKEIVNCKPVVRFDGSDDFLQSQSTGMISTSLNAATGFTFFVVTSHVSMSGTTGFNNYVFSFMHSSSYTGMTLNYRNDSIYEGNVYLGSRLGSGDSPKSLSSTGSASGTTHIWVGVVDIANDTMKIEGSSSTPTAGASFTPTSWVAASTSFYDLIGKQIGTTYPFHGDLVEILLYKNVFTLENRLQILDYLNKKYGLSI